VSNLRLKRTKFDFGWGSFPDSAGGVYSAPPDPLAGREEASSPILKNPNPHTAAHCSHAFFFLNFDMSVGGK